MVVHTSGVCERQEVLEFKANLGYIAKPHLKTTKIAFIR
jgi:hypothetical protein